jgi:hypothetical protein
MDADKEIAMVKWINAEKKLCDGIGMQSHVGTGFPSPDYYASALNKFLNAGLNVQITELDITNKGDSDMANYAYQLFKRINAAQKKTGRIKGITWWGLSDQTTWISNSKPLLFSAPGVKKPAFYQVQRAFTETFGNNPQPSQPTQAPTKAPTKAPTAAPTQTPSTQTPGSTANLSNGWYYIKNVNAQKYLQVAGNTGKNVQNVEIGTGSGKDGQKWYLENRGNGYVTLKSALGSFNCDIANGVNENEANVQIYSAHNGDAQQFMLKTTGINNTYTIATRCSNLTKVFDVYGRRTTDGTNVMQWQYTGAANQQWVFEPVNGQQAQPTKAPTKAPTSAPQPSSGKGMVLDYSINNWGSGYQVNMKVTNKTGAAVNSWTLKLNKNTVNITSSWNVNVKESGNYYVITPVSWNANLGNGASTEFGICGSGSIGNNIGYSFG